MNKTQKEQKLKYFMQVYDNIKNNGYHTTAILEEKNFAPLRLIKGSISRIWFHEKINLF
ncbi:hypothetical protein [Flavobacterium salmonis]|uniref:Uncharacterized protein n=1 Tax=Flavobacterium salmonis TaxID=2654844 RepID=A0A6V6Z281_9FLAO|nr:hypothetical protein [Flavobacterium salmonis]CAD0005833.1 hypothetical protein FLAT13_02997 [Flavobacterium salmonis]